MIFAVFDPSPLTVCINCSFFYIYWDIALTPSVTLGGQLTPWPRGSELRVWSISSLPLQICWICTSRGRPLANVKLTRTTYVLVSCSSSDRSSSSRVSESTLSDSRSRRNLLSLSQWHRFSCWLTLPQTPSVMSKQKLSCRRGTARRAIMSTTAQLYKKYPVWKSLQ